MVIGEATQCLLFLSVMFIFIKCQISGIFYKKTTLIRTEYNNDKEFITKLISISYRSTIW